ncbi:MAG: SDR family oxidoreductase [Kiritimatiellia bacterium]|nr:SDR family oxidoreductase [Kiritimatiellia bacterium]
MKVLESFSLKGKVALITGGAGLYGRQIVEALAEAGAKTYTASRNVAALEKVAEIHRKRGEDVTALQFDQGDEQSALTVRDRIFKESGKIDILVNNSVLRPMKEAYQDKASAFAESMKVNATGLFIITRAIGDVMTNGGSIINIGSIQGLIGPEPALYRGTTMSGFYPDYFFHKGGMVNLTRFLASYYGSKGIRCNCIHPGGFKTEKMPEAFVRQYCEHTCLGRLANEMDLKGIIVFLASDASVYVTGANIPIDGGYTAK